MKFNLEYLSKVERVLSTIQLFFESNGNDVQMGTLHWWPKAWMGNQMDLIGGEDKAKAWLLIGGVDFDQAALDRIHEARQAEYHRQNEEVWKPYYAKRDAEINAKYGFNPTPDAG
jgi:phage protein U